VAIDVLINNAGVFALGGAWVGGGEDGADYAGQMFGTFDYAQFDVFVATNVRGPMMVSEAFIEHVKASEQKKIIAISSENGRISGEPLCCGLFWYRMSKAALNKLFVQLSAVLREDGVIVVPLNPGAVRVEKQVELEFPGMLATDFSVGHMIETIGKLTLTDSGRFVNYDGTTAPW
jgi:NAD(P)-dependent dehydrogenase (short-subunit alcohol dehydrogenase family)